MYSPENNLNGYDEDFETLHDEELDMSIRRFPTMSRQALGQSSINGRAKQPTIAELQQRLNQTYKSGNHFRKSVAGSVKNGRMSATLSNSDKKSSASTFNSSFRLRT